MMPVLIQCITNTVLAAGVYAWAARALSEISKFKLQFENEVGLIDSHSRRLAWVQRIAHVA